MKDVSRKPSKIHPVADPRGVKERLEEALAAKEVVAIRYHGGSAPGAHREILPLRVTLRGKLQALDMSSRSMKLFVFANIELTELGASDDPSPSGISR